MPEATTLGTWLRRERERRGVTLTQISEQTKLSVPLLQGLEADDLSRWPGGIFRRAFARSYALAIGVDADLVVRRVEEEHPVADGPALPAVAAATESKGAPARSSTSGVGRPGASHTRSIAALLDLLVAGAIGLGFAAAGSRLLWPVLAIAAYHAIGLLLTGRSPMLALLLDQTEPAARPAGPVAVVEEMPPARLERTTAVLRAPTGRFRQPGRRGARASRARA
jgi:hypothetical protein